MFIQSELADCSLSAAPKTPSNATSASSVAEGMMELMLTSSFNTHNFMTTYGGPHRGQV